MPDAVIVATARTPIGRAHKGSFTEVRPDDMLAGIVKALLAKVPELDPGEVEDLIRREVPTELPDLEPFRLAYGSRLYPYDLLFPQPLNDRVESRNGGILDVGRHFAVGRVPVDRLRLRGDGGPARSRRHLGGGRTAVAACAHGQAAARAGPGGAGRGHLRAVHRHPVDGRP